jgi:glutamine synthetase adenylyltransferase
MTPANRRLADRIEILVTKALGTRDDEQLEQVIQELREALQEHAKRLREADAAHSKHDSAA